MVVCAGTATHWPEYLLYNLPTDDEERMQDIKNAAVPYNNVGLLEVRWIPLAGPDEGDEAKPVRDIDSEDDLLGKPWTYRLEIKRSADLPVFCEMAYVSYDFFGEACTTGECDLSCDVCIAPADDWLQRRCSRPPTRLCSTTARCTTSPQ